MLAGDALPDIMLGRTITRIPPYVRSCCAVGVLCLAPAFTSAIECSAIQFRGTRSTVCRVDIHTDHLQLFLNDDSGKPFTSFRRVAQSLAAHDERLAFAMNAAMY